MGKRVTFLHMHLIRSTTISWIEKQQMIKISVVSLKELRLGQGVIFQDAWF